MAAIPTKLEEAVTLLAAQFAADVTGAYVKRTPEELPPETLFENPASWPVGTTRLVEVVDGNPLKVLREPSRGETRRFQRAPIDVTVWLTENTMTGISPVFLTVRRQFLNAVEALFVARPFTRNQWTPEWESGGVLGAFRRRGSPYLGMRLRINFDFFE